MCPSPSALAHGLLPDAEAAISPDLDRSVQLPVPWSRVWLWSFIGWTAYVVIITLEIHLANLNQVNPGGRYPPLWRQFMIQSVGGIYWFVCTPVVFAASRRWPLIGRGALRHVAILIAMGFTLHAGGILTEHWTWPLVRRSTRPALPSHLLYGVIYQMLIFGMVVAAAHAVDFRALWRRGRLQALELRSQLLEARLQALSMQLEPHFLFNTLHAISELVYRDARAADQAIARLADLLRSTTANAGRPQIALAEEVGMLEAYLDILRLRFGDELRITCRVDPELRDARVPPLLIQPLVENAMRHGLRAGAGVIRIDVLEDGGRLRIDIADSGVGFSSLAPREGVGLSNTRLRLQHLYADRHVVEYGRAPEGGALVRIVLPIEGATS